MRLAAAFALLALPAYAVAPHDLLGFYPGQTAKDGFAVAKVHAAKPCDAAKNCVTFDALYLGRMATVSVELDEIEGVQRVAFRITTDRQPNHPECAALGGSVVAAAAKLYGKFNESDPGASYTWHDDKRKLKMTIICFSPTQGSIVGLFQKVSAAK